MQLLRRAWRKSRTVRANEGHEVGLSTSIPQCLCDEDAISILFVQELQEVLRKTRGLGLRGVTLEQVQWAADGSCVRTT